MFYSKISFKERGSNGLTIWSLREALPNVFPQTVDVSKGQLLRGFATKASRVFRLRTVSLQGCVGLASSSSFFSAPPWPPVSEELSSHNDKET